MKKAISAGLLGAIFFGAVPAYAVTPNDPNYVDQSLVWDQVNAPSAWEYSIGSKRIVVAMIDTGMDVWHEDLRANLWVNGEEVPNNGIDDDHNGFIDDIHGWNFVDDDNDVRTSVFDVADDKEAVRHGTLVGGQVGARGDNGLLGAGVNWRVSLMPLRAIRSDGRGSILAVVRAVNYAIANGADVINLSFVGDAAETTMLQALRRAYDNGIVVVAAVGNHDSEKGEDGNLDKKPLYPVCYDSQKNNHENWVLSVGSVDKDDVLSAFSNFGKCVDIMAPGEYIYNTERYAPQYGYPNEFGGPWFGTSFATPIVAGAAALIKSIHPEWRPSKIISTLLLTADVIDSKNPTYRGQLGGGRINIGRAVAFAAGNPVSEGKGSIYFTKDSVLWKAELGGERRQAPLLTVNGLPLSVTDFPNYNQERVAVLLKRGVGYFLDIFESNGRLVEEKAVPASAAAGRTIVKFASGILTVYSVDFQRSAGKSSVVVYNTRTHSIRKFAVSGEVTGLNIDDVGNLNWVIKEKNRFYFQSQTANNKRIFSVSLPGVSKVFANESAGNKSAIIAERGKKLVLMTLAANDGSLGERPLSGLASNNWHIKVIAMAGKSYFLPYSDKGGSFAAYDSDLSPVLTMIVGKR